MAFVLSLFNRNRDVTRVFSLLMHHSWLLIAAAEQWPRNGKGTRSSSILRSVWRCIELLISRVFDVDGKRGKMQFSKCIVSGCIVLCTAWSQRSIIFFSFSPLMSLDLCTFCVLNFPNTHRLVSRTKKGGNYLTISLSRMPKTALLMQRSMPLKVDKL